MCCNLQWFTLDTKTVRCRCSSTSFGDMNLFLFNIRITIYGSINISIIIQQTYFTTIIKSYTQQILLLSCYICWRLRNICTPNILQNTQYIFLLRIKHPFKLAKSFSQNISSQPDNSSGGLSTSLGQLSKLEESLWDLI